MNADELRALQAPIKARYKDHPDAAVVTLHAEGRIGDGVTCKVDTGRALVEAGLHPATGGDGLSACSGDMLLEALAACAGVTRATSTSAARWAWTARRRGASARSGCTSTSTPTPTRSSAPACSSSPSATAWCSRPSTAVRR